MQHQVEPLEAPANLRAPDVIAAEIVEDLRAALATFKEVQVALGESRLASAR